MMPMSLERITRTRSSGRRTLSASAAMKPALPPPRTITLLTLFATMFAQESAARPVPGGEGLSQCRHCRESSRALAAPGEHSEPACREQAQAGRLGNRADELHAVDADVVAATQPGDGHRVPRHALEERVLAVVGVAVGFGRGNREAAVERVGIRGDVV